MKESAGVLAEEGQRSTPNLPRLLASVRGTAGKSGVLSDFLRFFHSGDAKQEAKVK